MDRAFRRNGRKEFFQNNLKDNLSGKGLLGSPRRRWEYPVKMDLK